jgi:hypothetical protein
MTSHNEFHSGLDGQAPIVPEMCCVHVSYVHMMLAERSLGPVIWFPPDLEGDKATTKQRLWLHCRIAMPTKVC